VAFIQSLGTVALLVVTSSNRARYGIMAFPPSFKILPGTPSGPIGFILVIAAGRFLIVLMLMAKGSPE
jgi:hypothetical protein